MNNKIISMDNKQLSNPNIWRLLKITKNFVYWSNEVELFNSTINEPEKTKINNIVLGMLKEEKTLPVFKNRKPARVR